VQQVETKMWYRLYLMLALTSMPRTSNDVVFQYLKHHFVEAHANTCFCVLMTGFFQERRFG
jgi:hypothetical protein